MARGGFYGDNAHRAYPFLDADLGMPLPEAAVVDFGCVMGLTAGYDDSDHAVYLHQVYRGAAAYRFEFRTTAPALAGRGLVFDVPAGSAEHASFVAADDLAPGSSGSSAGGADDPAWEGWLVVGDLAALAAVLAEGESLDDPGGDTRVEPARVQNLARSYVRAVHLANADRVRVEAPDGCAPGAPGTAGLVRVHTRNLTGDLVFAEGYNAAVRQADADNALTLGAAVGGGAGQPCGEVPTYPGETPPAGSTLLTGGPGCGDVLKSVNGVGGRVIRLTAGPGVRITPGAAEGELVVAVDLHGLAVCRASSISV